MNREWRETTKPNAKELHRERERDALAERRRKNGLGIAGGDGDGAVHDLEATAADRAVMPVVAARAHLS
jgi:hypothetical protein